MVLSENFPDLNMRSMAVSLGSQVLEVGEGSSGGGGSSSLAVLNVLLV